MSMAYGPADEKESFKFSPLSGTRRQLLDTAEVYGPYKNEELLGRFLREVPRDTVNRRHQIWFPHRSDGIRGVD